MPVRFTLKSLFFSAAFILPSSFVAADGPFERQDTNQDGVLSGREALDLQLLDQDGDKEISLAEFTDAAKEQRSKANRLAHQIFADRDTNHDQRLSGTEMSGYENFDQDGNSRLSETEFKTGFAFADPEIRDMSFAEIVRTAADRFNKIDINEDGRLTGTEAAGSGHFDRNEDGRITSDEFIIGLILSTASGDSVKPDEQLPMVPLTEERIHQTLANFIRALDDVANAELITEALHPRIRNQVDQPIFEYTLEHAKSSHGKMKLPPKSQIRISTLENGDTEANADLKCDRGHVKLVVQFSEGKIIGFMIDSPELQELEASLYKDLEGDELQQRFANFYATIAKGPLDSIMKGEDDVAAAWIHPTVVEEVGRDKFYELFRLIRERLTKVKSTELETFATEVTADNIRKFTVTQIVTGTSSVQRYATTFQCVGMDAVVTGLSIENASDLTPAPSPKPVTPPEDSMAARWFETVSLRDGISFRTPGEAQRSEMQSADGDLTRYQYELPEQGMIFQVDIIRLKVDISTASKTFFDTVKTQIVQETGGEIAQERILDADGPLPSQALVVVKENGQTTILRSVVDGSRVYSFQWSGAAFDDNADSNFARPFHESVRLIDESGALRPGFTIPPQKGAQTESATGDSATPPAPNAAPAPPTPPVSSDDDLAPPPAPSVTPEAPVLPPAPAAPPTPVPM